MLMNKLLYRGPSLQELHERYAKQGRIDPQAGSQALDSIDINAPIETVWEVVVDMAAWPTFNPLISDVRLDSTVAADANASFKVNKFPINLTFAVVEPLRELSWTGRAAWAKAIDRLWLERVSDDKTRLHLDESLSGLFVPLMTSSSQLHKQHQASLHAFKAAAEARKPLI